MNLCISIYLAIKTSQQIIDNTDANAYTGRTK